MSFDESAKADILELFGKKIDKEGFIVEKDDENQKVLTKEGEEIHNKEWAGIVKSSEAFLKSDTFSLVKLAKKLQ